MSLENHWRLFHDDFCETVSTFPWEPSLAKAALRTALSCVIAVWLTYFLRIPHAYWAGISVLIMMQPHVAAELKKGWQRAGGACIGSFFGVFYAGIVAQSPLLFTILSFLIVTIGTYLGNTRKYGYFWYYMAFHLHMICMLSIMGSSGQENIEPGSLYPVHIAFYRASAVSIGVIVSVIMNLIIKPDFAFDIARKKALELKEELKEFLDIIAQDYLAEKFNDERFDKKYLEIQTSINSYTALFEHSRVEQKFFFDEELPITRLQANEIKKRIRDLSLHYKALANADKLEYHNAYRELLEKMPALFYNAMLSGKKEDEEKLRENLDAMMASQSRDSAGNLLYEMKDIILFRGFTGSLRKLFRAIFQSEFAVSEEKPIQNESFSIKSCIQNINRPILKTSLRSGFAIIFVFWLWLWLEIPGGGGSMAISIIAVLQANIISSQHKALLRFAGCFAGAAAGLFVLALSIDSTLIIFIILFLFIFFFAYIWAGKPGAAYTGAQAALAFLVCVMSSDAPASSVSSGIERLTGIFCGISCLWIINNVFFPIDMPAYFRSAFDDVKYEILRRIKRAEDILSSGNSNIIPNPIDTENIAQLISQLKAFNEISAKEVADSQKTLALLDEISISSGKASELLLMREKYKIELSGHYREIFEILRSILLRGPDELKEKEDSFKNLEEELLKEAETHLAYDGKKYKEERQRVFISEVFLNKTELIREIFNLGRSDCYTPPLQQEQNA